MVNLLHMKELIPHERIEAHIYVIRGVKVMLDRDLANLYGTEIRTLNQAVRRNIERFPEDFCLQLTPEEWNSLRSQIVTLNKGRGGKGFRPLAFTEPGVAMLSSVLKSPQAIAINIQIIRAFIRMRDLLISESDLRRKVEAMEKQYDEQFRIVFRALREAIADEQKPEIGYKP